MMMAGKYGLGVLGISAPRGDLTLRDFWSIAEAQAQEHGKTVSRDEWRLVVHVHLADTKEQAFEDVRTRASSYWRDYFEGTMGFPRPFESDRESIVEGMNERHTWCIGTPEDLVEAINRLDDASGGFGGLLIQQVDWATREQVMHSFELIARYVKPQFQGSLIGLRDSQAVAERQAEQVAAARTEATGLARAKYEEGKVTSL